MSQLLIPPFTYESAVRKVRLAEDAWNSRDVERIASAYSPDTRWRNRSEFIEGRDAVTAFLERKWDHELEYRLIKELWAFGWSQIAVRFQYEWHNMNGQWFRSYGNENWEFAKDGLMEWRQASINDVAISESERLFHWDRSGPRPANHPSLSELGV